MFVGVAVDVGKVLVFIARHVRIVGLRRASQREESVKGSEPCVLSDSIAILAKVANLIEKTQTFLRGEEFDRFHDLFHGTHTVTLQAIL